MWRLTVWWRDNIELPLKGFRSPRRQGFCFVVLRLVICSVLLLLLLSLLVSLLLLLWLLLLIQCCVIFSLFSSCAVKRSICSVNVISANMWLCLGRRTFQSFELKSYECIWALTSCFILSNESNISLVFGCLSKWKNSLRIAAAFSSLCCFSSMYFFFPSNKPVLFVACAVWAVHIN